jgi:hypothetical protein
VDKTEHSVKIYLCCAWRRGGKCPDEEGIKTNKQDRINNKLKELGIPALTKKGLRQNSEGSGRAAVLLSEDPPVLPSEYLP